LIVWGMVKRGKKDKVLKNHLARLGFVPCDEEAEALAEKVTLLENNSEYAYSIRKPMKVSVGDTHVYFYTKDRRRSGDLDVSEEFFLTLKRKKSLPFQIYLKPSSVKEGMATDLLRSVTTKGWDSQSDDLEKVQLPLGLRYGNILGLMGPRDCTVHGIFDSAALSLLVHGADNDVFTIHCRENLCSIGTPLAGHKGNYEKIWSFIQRLIQQGL